MCVILIASLTIGIGAQQNRSMVQKNDAERQRRNALISAQVARSRRDYELRRQSWTRWAQEQKRINPLPQGAASGTGRPGWARPSRTDLHPPGAP